jgi:hypothetical protein
MEMGTVAAATLTIAMIAVFLLTAGGARLVIRRENRQKGWLMIVAAMVLLGNVLIWTI